MSLYTKNANKVYRMNVIFNLRAHQVHVLDSNTKREKNSENSNSVSLQKRFFSYGQVEEQSIANFLSSVHKTWHEFNVFWWFVWNEPCTCISRNQKYARLNNGLCSCHHIRILKIEWDLYMNSKMMQPEF